VENTGGTVVMLLMWPLLALAISKAKAFSHAVIFVLFGGIGEAIRGIVEAIRQFL
jgi:hypothetical protein